MADADTAADTTSLEEQPAGISHRLVLLLAGACGISVANLYYAQPLLHTMAGALHSGTTVTGLVVTFSQIGYALGLGFLVPVGDLIERRRLVPVVLVACTVGLVVTALSPDIGLLVGVAILVGVGAAAQMLVPLAASMASEESRGKVVGTVMTGLVTGILLARTLSGVLAGATSWRVVYFVAAGMALVLGAVLGRVLPAEHARPQLTYWQLLRSTASIMVALPVLRRRAVFGALGFAAFSVFWTTYGFMLAGPHYHYDDIVIGLFGLVGAAGAMAASSAGRVADRGHARLATIVFSLATLVSFVPIYLGHRSLSLLIFGIVLLDIGVQGLQVTNQSIIYRLDPSARSRINACYMVTYFIGGAIGSALAGACYDAGGWLGACILGGALAGLGVLVEAVTITRAG